jgi:hypothetical protein
VFFPTCVHELTQVKESGWTGLGLEDEEEEELRYKTKKKRLGTVTCQGFEEAAFANTD